jgi:HD superfamily phosphohydrolase
MYKAYYINIQRNIINSLITNKYKTFSIIRNKSIYSRFNTKYLNLSSVTSSVTSSISTSTMDYEIQNLEERFNKLPQQISDTDNIPDNISNNISENTSNDISALNTNSKKMSSEEIQTMIETSIKKFSEIHKDYKYENILATISPVEVAIMSADIFTRLSRIYQITGGNFYGFNHTRFEHSVGAMIICGLIAENNKSILNTVYHNDPQIIQKLRICGLIHDIGHSAFSHGIEKAMRVRFPNVDKTHDKMRNIALNSFNDIFAKYHIDKNSIISILDESHNLFPVVQGVLGADRLDYLYRDYYNMRQEFKMPNVKLSDIVNNTKINTNGVMYYTTDTFENIVIDLLKFRKNMYLHAYCNQQSAGCNALIEYLTISARDEISEISKLINTSPDDMETFIKIDDNEFIDILLAYDNVNSDGFSYNKLVNILKNIKHSPLNCIYDVPMIINNSTNTYNSANTNSFNPEEITKMLNNQFIQKNNNKSEITDHDHNDNHNDDRINTEKKLIIYSATPELAVIKKKELRAMNIVYDEKKDNTKFIELSVTSDLTNIERVYRWYLVD